MIKEDNINTILGSDPRLTILQILLSLGLFLLYAIWAHWNEMAESYMYIIAFPLGVFLIRKSYRILSEDRPTSHRRLAQFGTVVGFLLLIPKWLLYVWLGWQIGLLD